MPRWLKRGDRVAVLLIATSLVAAAVLGYFVAGTKKASLPTALRSSTR
jgi:acyl-CoA synthetase (AMP-forming)/AMP-acid ligase II